MITARTFGESATTMKGINILYDAKGKKRQVQIDVSGIEKNPELVEDILDVIVCESRRNELTITLADFRRDLAKRKKR